MKPKALLDLLKQTVSEFGEDKAPQLAAALSYYTIFSIAPLLVIVIAIAGLAFGQDAAQNKIVDQITGVVGSDAANLIQTMIQNVNKPGAGTIATIIGGVTLLAGAAGVYGQLKNSLNTIWNIEPKPGPGGIKGVISGLLSQVLSFGMVLGTGFLLLVSLVLSAALAALGSWLGERLPIPSGVWELINAAVSFGVITLLFAAIYKFLPDVTIKWRDVLLGAAVTSLLFALGKFLIGLYLGKTVSASAYGAAGALVVLLLWIYYSAQILFFGAEFTQVYARTHGSLLPQPGAAQPATVAQPSGRPLSKRERNAAAALMLSKAADDHATAAAPRKPDRTEAIARAIRVLSPMVLLIARIVIMIEADNRRNRPRSSTR